MLSGCAALLGLSKGYALSKERKDKPCAISFVPSSEIVVVRIQSIRIGNDPACHRFEIEGHCATEFASLVVDEYFGKDLSSSQHRFQRTLILSGFLAPFTGDEGLKRARDIYENAAKLYRGSVEFVTMPEVHYKLVMRNDRPCFVDATGDKPEGFNEYYSLGEVVEEVLRKTRPTGIAKGWICPGKL